MKLLQRLRPAAAQVHRSRSISAGRHRASLGTKAGLPSHPVVYHEDFKLSPLPEGHRFPMPKDALLYQRLQQLGLAGATFMPTYPDAATLELVHEPEYVAGFLSGTLDAAAMRRIGLPWSESLVKRTLIGTGSAILAARLAVQYGVAVMCNGGTHHAHAGHGSGWCIFNDQAVAARAAQRDMGVEHVLFIDLDVHQGDGTATIFADDESVFTCSVHCCEQSFPHVLQRSDLDVPLPAGTTDVEYLKVLQRVLPRVLGMRSWDLVFYNAGVDVHVDDSLGMFALSDDGIRARDKLVFELCSSFGAPVAAAIGGGYSRDHSAIVERHVSLHQAAFHALPHMQASCSVLGKRAAA